MTIARVHLVDPLVSRWYHCITRCVRRAMLLGEKTDRKDWIENRLKELAEVFGIAVAGFAVLDNHLHLLVRLDPETVKNWSDEEEGSPRTGGIPKDRHWGLDAARFAVVTCVHRDGKEQPMTIARVHLVDPLVSRWYHCITRCVRRARLLGEGMDRKEWIEHRLKELAEIFGISVAGFAVLDNHLHLLVRLDPETVKNWSDEEVIRRWARLFPPRDKMRRPLELSDDWVKGHLLNAAWIKRARQRLGSLSWFMKCLKEPLARLANRQDQATGAFFEGRFKSIAVLDEGSLLATCAYIDLNPLAAGIAATPEASVHTSIKERVDHVAAQERTEDLTAAHTSSAAASKQAAGLEEKLWLCPVEDRRRIDSTREGMIEGFALGSYLLLVDYTARFFREGKATLSGEMAEILDRLHTSAEQWQARLNRLRTGRPLGRFFAATRARLREIGTRLNLKHVPNLGGCPVT